MQNKICARLRFGSHLYGTNTSNSDIDYRTFVVPDPRRYMVEREVKSMVKVKFNPDGRQATPNAIMGAGCVEDEEIHINRLFLDVADGEVQAIESLFAILQGRIEYIDVEFYELCQSFFKQFGNQINRY